MRNAPLDLRHPVDIAETTKVLLPDDWKLDADTTTVSDPAFEFSSKLTATPRVMTLENKYRSVTDHVAVSDTAKYVANLKLARDALSYTVSKPVPTKHQ